MSDEDKVNCRIEREHNPMIIVCDEEDGDFALHIIRHHIVNGLIEPYNDYDYEKREGKDGQEWVFTLNMQHRLDEALKTVKEELGLVVN